MKAAILAIPLIALAGCASNGEPFDQQMQRLDKLSEVATKHDLQAEIVVQFGGPPGVRAVQEFSLGPANAQISATLRTRPK